MLETTIIAAEAAVLVGSVATTGTTAGKIEKDDKGTATGILINKKKAAVGTLMSSTATSATYIGQELSYQNTLNNVRDAQAYIESMSDDKLSELAAMLEEKEAEFAEGYLDKSESAQNEVTAYQKTKNFDKKMIK